MVPVVSHGRHAATARCVRSGRGFGTHACKPVPHRFAANFRSVVCGHEAHAERPERGRRRKTGEDRAWARMLRLMSVPAVRPEANFHTRRSGRASRCRKTLPLDAPPWEHGATAFAAEGLRQRSALWRTGAPRRSKSKAPTAGGGVAWREKLRAEDVKT